ncbi:thioesterase II family protein [Lysinibacillus parviboronicapiens]|uniref:thioesterase II family protein n=1 Tax=Lysinibacillus parviboronicapiens TaxID=436516 RepID=UPI00142E2CBF|nr:alpha/beta fold hydrolase [Lysinibacillus parviboronicapiens]
MNPLTLTKYNSWIVTFKAVKAPRLRLFCFPFAGGNALTYKDWSDYLPEDVEVCCMQLPGRGNRLMEEPISNFPTLLEAIEEAFLPFIDDVPFVFFGHSMGALIAFEFTRYLEKRHQIRPDCLLVSAHRAPHLPRKSSTLYHALPNNELLERLKSLNGTPDWFFNEQELVELSLPMIKADLELCECYVYEQGPSLEIPIIAFGGTRDKEVSKESILQWEQITNSSFQMFSLPGNHFFLNSSQDRLLSEIYKYLRTI